MARTAISNKQLKNRQKVLDIEQAIYLEGDFYNSNTEKADIGTGLSTVEEFNENWVKSQSTNFSYPHGILYVRDYLYVVNRQMPARIAKINTHNFSDITIFTFPGTNSTSEFIFINDITYSAHRDRIYVSFSDPEFGNRKLKIYAINPDDITDYSVVIDETSNNISAGSPLLTTHGEKLYVVTTYGTKQVREYSLNTYNLIQSVSIPVTSTEQANSLVADDTYLYIAEVYGDAKLKRLNLSTFLFDQSLELPTRALTSNLIIAGEYVWTTTYTESDPNTSGNAVYRVKKDLSTYDTIYAEGTADNWGMYFDGEYIWFNSKTNPTKLSRIDPQTLEVRSKTLPTGYNRFNKMVTDGISLFFTTYESPARIVKLAIPVMDDEVYFAGTNNDVLFKASNITKKIELIDTIVNGDLEFTDNTVKISRDGSDNLVLTDVNVGSLTLTQLYESALEIKDLDADTYMTTQYSGGDDDYVVLKVPHLDGTDAFYIRNSSESGSTNNHRSVSFSDNGQIKLDYSPQGHIQYNRIYNNGASLWFPVTTGPGSFRFTSDLIVEGWLVINDNLKTSTNVSYGDFISFSNINGGSSESIEIGRKGAPASHLPNHTMLIHSGDSNQTGSYGTVHGADLTIRGGKPDLTEGSGLYGDIVLQNVGATNGGYVAIGHSSPTEKLDVVGNMLLNGYEVITTTTADNSDAFVIKDSTNSQVFKIDDQGAIFTNLIDTENKDVYIEANTGELKARFNINSFVATIGATKGDFATLKGAVDAGYTKFFFVENYTETENIGVSNTSTYSFDGFKDIIVNMDVYTFGICAHVKIYNIDFRWAYQSTAIRCFTLFGSGYSIKVYDATLTNNCGTSDSYSLCYGNSSFKPEIRKSKLVSNGTNFGLNWAGNGVGLINDCDIYGSGTLMQMNIENSRFYNDTNVYMNEKFSDNILYSTSNLNMYNGVRQTVITGNRGESAHLGLTRGSGFMGGAIISNNLFSSFALSDSTGSPVFLTEISNTTFTSTTDRDIYPQLVSFNNCNFYHNIRIRKLGVDPSRARFIGCTFGTNGDKTKTLTIDSDVDGTQVIGCSTGIDIVDNSTTTIQLANNLL